MPFARVNEIYDLNTVKGRITLLKFHTPQDGTIQKHLAGHFMQYRRWMYGGMDIAMIPVATLPLDPLGVSLSAGEPNADPRDVINPICHRYYHGEKLNVRFDFRSDVASGGVGGTTDTSVPYGQSVQEGQILETDTAGGTINYASTLMDTSWRKAHVQKGFRVSTRPLVYPMMSNHQIGESAAIAPTEKSVWTRSPHPDLAVNGITNIPADVTFPTTPSSGAGNWPTTSPQMPAAAGLGVGSPIYERSHLNVDSTGSYKYSTRYQNMFTAGLRPLGWMDTEPFLTHVSSATSGNVAGAVNQSSANIRCPLVYMYTALLPPAFKTNMYFRLIISHKIAFKGYRSTQGLSGLGMDTLIPFTPNFNAGLPISATGSLIAENGELTLVTDGVAPDE